MGRRAIFLDEDDYRFYLTKLAHAQKQYDIRILAYCLMPNHVHLLVQQLGEGRVGKLISSVHTSYAKRFNGKYRRVGHIFQGRFRQVIIQRDVYLRYLVAYIHLNPVAAKLVAHPKEYPWSSWHAYVQRKKDAVCQPGPILKIFGGTGGYIAFEKEGREWKAQERWEKIRNVIIE